MREVARQPRSGRPRSARRRPSSRARSDAAEPASMTRDERGELAQRRQTSSSGAREHREHDRPPARHAARCRRSSSIGRVGAEERHPPAPIPQQEREHDEPEIVAAPRAGRPSSACLPVPRPHPRPSAMSRARTRLLAKCSCATVSSPRSHSLADLVEKWQDDVTEERLQAQRGDEAVERGMGGAHRRTPRGRDGARGPARRSRVQRPGRGRTPGRPEPST